MPRGIDRTVVFVGYGIQVHCTFSIAFLLQSFTVCDALLCIEDSGIGDIVRVTNLSTSQSTIGNAGCIV